MSRGRGETASAILFGEHSRTAPECEVGFEEPVETFSINTTELKKLLEDYEIAPLAYDSGAEDISDLMVNAQEVDVINAPKDLWITIYSASAEGDGIIISVLSLKTRAHIIAKSTETRNLCSEELWQAKDREALSVAVISSVLEAANQSVADLRALEEIQLKRLQNPST